jgi:hypothetical protein
MVFVEARNLSPVEALLGRGGNCLYRRVYIFILYDVDVYEAFDVIVKNCRYGKVDLAAAFKCHKRQVLHPDAIGQV